MTAYGSQGVLLKRGATTIGQVVSIAFGGMTKEFIDVTHLNSTQRYREKLSSLRDAGTIAFRILYDPVLASHELIETDYESDTTTTWSVVFPDAAPTTWSCAAGVSNMGPQLALGEAFTMECELTLTGVPTLD